MTAKHVAREYKHYAKRISPGEIVSFGSSRLKWYDVAKVDAPVEPHVRTLARNFLARAPAHTDWPLDEDVGFVTLHRCGEAFYFLALCTWRGDNELWQTVYFKPDAAAPDFALFPQEVHKGTFCVWEAGIALHEFAAWSRYLRSARDAKALEAYFADQASGEVV